MDYILKYTNPKSDVEKKIVAKITVNLDFVENKTTGNPPVDTKRYNGVGNGILEGLPTTYTNTVTNQPVPNTGTIGPITEKSYLEISGTSSKSVDSNGNLTEIGINNMYMVFLDSVRRKLYQEYKKVYGLELYQTISYDNSGKPYTLTTFEPVVEKIEGSSLPNQTDESLGQTASGVTASGVTASGITASTDPVKSTATQSVVKITGDYIFDITKDGYLVNKDLGELKIVSKEEALKADQEFDFTAEELTVSDEYIEGSFAGDPELFEAFLEYVAVKNIDTGASKEETQALIQEIKNDPPGKPQKTPPASVIKAMKDYGITDPLEKAHFLAQCAHESGGFAWKTEFASGKAYEGRKTLGNTQKGDGVKFKGRGYIQITGRANYTEYNKYIKSKGYTDDVVANPELLAGKFAADCSVWFWSILGPQGVKNFPVRSRKGSSESDINKIGSWINGANPPNGADDRISKFKYYWSVLQKDGRAYS